MEPLHLRNAEPTDWNRSGTNASDLQATIRPAHPSEAVLLTALAQAAKRHWGYPDEWLEAWRDQLTLTPAYITAHTVRCGCIDGDRVVGFYALESDNVSFQLAHLWLAP